jgi:glycosyltransferase involved in cell wall biosynthesis
VFATGVERALGHRTDAVICVCEDERRAGARAGLSPDRMHVVLNGCAAPPDVAPDPVLEAMRREGPVAATVAVLRRQKRIDVFLDAVPHVWARLPEARLAVVGTGPLREELTAQARALGILDDPRFAFVDFVSPPARHLRALDAYVLSSGWEGLPIGVLEALSCGVPQVATAAGGTPEAVGPDTGRLVDPGDPAALGAAIADVLGDPDARAAMATASVARWREHFQLPAMVAATAGVYAGVLDARRSAA